MSTANKFKYVENFETEIKWLKPLKKKQIWALLGFCKNINR